LLTHRGAFDTKQYSLVQAKGDEYALLDTVAVLHHVGHTSKVQATNGWKKTSFFKEKVCRFSGF